MAGTHTNTPRQKIFGGAFIALFCAVSLYALQNRHQGEVDLHAQLLDEVRDIGKSGPEAAPKGTPVRVVIEVTGAREICDSAIGPCVDAAAYARDVQTRAAVEVIDDRPRERGRLEKRVRWVDAVTDPHINPEPLSNHLSRRVVSPDIATASGYTLSHAAIEALLSRPGATLDDTDIDPAAATYAYAGEGWWRPDRPVELGMQRIRARSVPAGDYTFIAAVEGDRLIPAQTQGKSVLIAAEGAVPAPEVARQTAPETQTYVLWIVLPLSGLMAAGYWAMLAGVSDRSWVIFPGGCVLATCTSTAIVSLI